jgi:hypothetical protein
MLGMGVSLRQKYKDFLFATVLAAGMSSSSFFLLSFFPRLKFDVVVIDIPSSEDLGGEIVGLALQSKVDEFDTLHYVFPGGSVLYIELDG